MKKSHRFRTTVATYFIEFKNLEGCPDVDQVLYSAFSRLIETAFSEGGENDKVGILIRHPTLCAKIGVPFTRRSLLTTEKVMDLLHRFIQSSAQCEIDERLTVEATRVSIPKKCRKIQFFRKECTHLAWFQQDQERRLRD